jgi:hypothetical protein
MGKAAWTKCKSCMRKLHKKKGQSICVDCRTRQAREERKKNRQLAQA